MPHQDLDLELQPLSRSKLIEHLSQLEVIDAKTLGEPWGQAQWLLDVPSKWELSWLLLCEKQPIGFVIASRKESALHIHRLAVAAEERCKGLGKLLMAAAARRALEQGCAVITLKVQRTNMGAISFYTRLGFTASGRRRDNLEMTGDSRQVFETAQNMRLQTAQQQVEQ